MLQGPQRGAVSDDKKMIKDQPARSLAKTPLPR